MTDVLGGRYRLVERLGAGGMSVVWRGFDEVLGRPVAVKVLATRLADDRSFRRRIRTEAQAAARLLHPHITNVYDYGEQNAVPYVVMELVDGRSLADRLGADGALPWPEALTAGRQVAEALAAAHARGVVHRDVTPGNVMLTAAGVKVVDFGISALVGERDIGADGSLLGTPAYLAPERLDGGAVTPASDVYALGLLLYRCLAGRLPWPATSRVELLRAHLYAEPEPLPPVDGLPAGIAALTARCLAKNPGDRPTSAEIARALTDHVTVATPVRAVVGPSLVADAGTTILSWSTATDAVSWTGRAVPATPSGGASRRFGRAAVAAAGVALLAVTGAVWAKTGRTPTEGTLAAGAGAPAAAAPVAPIECEVRYRLTADTGQAFTALVTVVNAGSTAVEPWRLSFSFPGDQTVKAVAGRVVQEGRDVTVRGTATLAAGSSTAVRLSGGYATSNAFPLDFALDGNACRPSVSGIPAAPPTGPTVTRKAPPKKAPPEKAQAARDDDDSGKGGGNSGKGKGKDDD
jgi:serine/threonine-protein kinase